MPYGTNIYDIDFKKQTSLNIYNLMNDKSFNVVECLQHFQEPYMLQFFEVYQEFGCEPSAFLHCILTTIGALSEGIMLSNVISHSDTSINLMTHIIAEPGEKYFIVE